MIGEQTVAERLAVLADPTRQALLDLLREKPQRVGDLAAGCRSADRPCPSTSRCCRRPRSCATNGAAPATTSASILRGFEAVRRYAELMWQDALNAFAEYVNEQVNQPSAKRRKGKKR